MNILSINAGQDTAGQSIRMKQAFDRYTDWTFHSVIRSPTYINYPIDVAWNDRTVRDLWRDADVVHLHNSFSTAKLLERRLREKPSVIHHHGTMFRNGPLPHLREQHRRKAIAIVSTLDLYLIAPDMLEWLPAPYDLRWLEALRQHHRRLVDGRIRIAHAPTNREIKSTEQFLAATKRLVDEGYPVDVDLIEKVPWMECLKRKAAADVFFDQVILGFGCNSIEAWGMGIPVIAGAADPTLDEYERRFGYLPFHHATQETIYDALREMVESQELRDEYADIGRRYVAEYHDDAKVTAQLQDIYTRALAQYEGKKAA